MITSVIIIKAVTSSITINPALHHGWWLNTDPIMLHYEIVYSVVISHNPQGWSINALMTFDK